ncbi:SET domain-containing protein [Mytilinidion resinicola]|uniref:SET domain-containing protein n=1 Tax=Mytilinidion resinicola TaxID=574789 RepID=A0A6A6Z5Y3_9PEZI|nr:SET domain-containing protein [Mytilinidion resinicola]KAF2816512.1 SET domain-containing protein [Mytilinidion resinicola]
MSLKARKSGRSGKTKGSETNIADTTQITLPLQRTTRKHKLEEEVEDDKPQKKPSTKRANTRGSQDYFMARYAEDQYHQVPNFRVNDTEGLVYPVEVNKNFIRPTEWAKIKKPGIWPNGAPWPPTQTSDLTMAYSREAVCANCRAHPRDVDCGCEIEEWQEHQAVTWRDNFELREIPDMGVGVFALKDVDARVVVGELAGLLRPSTHKASGSAKHYECKLEIGPYQDVKQQPYAYIDVWKYGSWTRFINHSCEPNTEFLEARVGRTRLLTCETTQKIKAGRQVTVDYGEGFFESDNKCRCGTKSCDNPYQEGDSADEEEEMDSADEEDEM